MMQTAENSRMNNVLNWTGLVGVGLMNAARDQRYQAIGVHSCSPLFPEATTVM